jgi:small subunit ribosomal protein S18
MNCEEATLAERENESTGTQNEERRPSSPQRFERRSSDRRGPARGRRPGRRQYGRRRRKVCYFCTEHVKTIDYKDVSLLRQYLSQRGRIRARRQTGTCARHQRMLALAIKRARHIALLPYTAKHARLSGA